MSRYRAKSLIDKPLSNTPLLVVVVGWLLVQTLQLGVNGQGVSLSLGGTTYPNNSAVPITDVGFGDDGLYCRTTNTNCCRRADNPAGVQLGWWFYPNGSEVLSFTQGGREIQRSRGTGEVRLNRDTGYGSALSPTGVYRCVIPDANGVNQTLLVTLDVNECTSGAAVCVSGATCVNTLGSFTCTCPSGLTGDGRTSGTGCTVPVQLIFRGVSLPNNSVLSINDVGEFSNGGAVLCTTDRNPCCQAFAYRFGQWYYPDGTQVPSDVTGEDFYRGRLDNQTIHLNRRNNAQSPTGSFCCELPDSRDVILLACVELVAADGSFLLNGQLYANNSIVDLEEIGEDSAALLCLTDRTDCCRSSDTPPGVGAIGNWHFPNGSAVGSNTTGNDIYRTRGASVVLLHRRGNAQITGVFCCEIPDASGVDQTLYVGVYPAMTTEEPTTETTTTEEITTAGVGLLLNGQLYANNNNVTLEEIGEDSAALICLTDNTDCCRSSDTPEGVSSLGIWRFPNGDAVGSNIAGDISIFYRTRGPSMVILHRRGNPQTTGVFSCDIPDANGVEQTLYVGVYSATTTQPLTVTASSTETQPPMTTTMATEPPPTTSMATEPPLTTSMATVPPRTTTMATEPPPTTTIQPEPPMTTTMETEPLVTVEEPTTETTTTEEITTAGVGLLLNGQLYANNSIVTLDEIGEGSAALICLTDKTDCCRSSDTLTDVGSLGIWRFPNGNSVGSNNAGEYDIFYRTRGPSMVLLHRRNNAQSTGVFRCEIPDANGVEQTLYVGVYQSVMTTIPPITIATELQDNVVGPTVIRTEGSSSIVPIAAGMAAVIVILLILLIVTGAIVILFYLRIHQNKLDLHSQSPPDEDGEYAYAVVWSNTKGVDIDTTQCEAYGVTEKRGRRNRQQGGDTQQGTSATYEEVT